MSYLVQLISTTFHRLFKFSMFAIEGTSGPTPLAFPAAKWPNLISMSNIAGVLKDFFASHQQKVSQATAPGCLDVMGGVADVAGGLLIQQALEQLSTAYVAFRDDQRITLKLIYQTEEMLHVTCDYNEIVGQFPTLNYEYARLQLEKISTDEAVKSLIGCLLVLYDERDLKFEGIDIVITSEIPLHTGTGAISSYEVALLKAVCNRLNLDLREYDIPLMVHRAENWVGGFCSGPREPMASFAGHPNKLTPLICQPGEVFHPIDVPNAIAFVGIDSGVPVSLSDEAYGTARAAMFMGYSIIALASGASVRDLELARETQRWSELPYQGYIANINPSEFEDKFLPILPDTISGQEFFEKYQTSVDIISFIDRDKEYDILKCTRHPVYENFRAKLFAQIIKNYTTEFQNYSSRLSLLGELMYQSHQSYLDCGLSHPQADDIVARVKERGSKQGLYGARIVGRGGGGTVCILCGGLSGPEHASEIHQEYEQALGQPVAFFK